MDIMNWSVTYLGERKWSQVKLVLCRVPPRIPGTIWSGVITGVIPTITIKMTLRIPTDYREKVWRMKQTQINSDILGNSLYNTINQDLHISGWHYNWLSWYGVKMPYPWTIWNIFSEAVSVSIIGLHFEMMIPFAMTGLLCGLPKSEWDEPR